jgi:hypothetical protein
MGGSPCRGPALWLVHETTQVIQTVRRDGSGPLPFCKDKPALDHCLHVQREALGSPVAPHAVLPHRGGDIRFQRLRMHADALFARRADFGVCAIGFLNDGPDEAGEFGQFARQ